jgi:hypothetical protein
VLCSALVVYQCFPAYLACYSALVFHSALVLSQFSLLCSCVLVGHYKWFLVQCNELSHIMLYCCVNLERVNTWQLLKHQVLNATVPHLAVPALQGQFWLPVTVLIGTDCRQWLIP